MRIIGLTGPAGCGKSTAAEYLVRHHDFVEMSFADPLKDMLAAFLALPREKLDLILADRTFKESPLAALSGQSPRYALQTLGTEWGRNLMHPDLWLVGLRTRMEWIEHTLAHEYRGIVISDVRFANEATFIRERGTLIHLRRQHAQQARNHVSEAGVDFKVGDQIINNSGATVELFERLNIFIRRNQSAA